MLCVAVPRQESCHDMTHVIPDLDLDHDREDVLVNTGH